MLAVWVSCKIDNIANFSNIGASEEKFGSLDGGDDGEYNGVGFVERDLKYLQCRMHISLELHHRTEFTNTK